MAPKIPEVPKTPKGTVQGKPVKNYYINDNNEVVIKVRPLNRSGESVEQKRKRLLYQSRKRGILETDILLSRFADRYLPTMSAKEMEEYDKLLDEVDWDIYYWATEDYDITPLPDRWKNSAVLKKLQALSKNEDKEVLRMPDLRE